MASATTCTEAIARCKAAGKDKPCIESQCQAAGAGVCMNDGTFVGPVSGTTWRNLRFGKETRSLPTPPSFRKSSKRNGVGG
jgi:hypothetical protein